MKKLITFLLSAVLLLSAGVMLTACTPDPEEYTVTYIYDNGQDNLVTTVEAGKTAVRPKDPVKEGFAFGGWFVDGSDTEYSFDAAVNADLTLKAHWTQDGGSVTPAEARLTFREYDYIQYVFDGDMPRRAPVGSTVRFKLKESPYYVGTPIVKAGDTELTADNNGGGYYSFEVTGDTLITVTGYKRDNTPIPGLGSAASPYVISTASQLKTFTDAVNDPENTKYNSAYVKLGADIALNGFTLEPIGNALNTAHFEGVFDGAGHTVSDFTVYSETGLIGFFGYLVQGEIKNLHLEEADIDVELLTEQNYFIGGIAAYNMGGDVFGCSFDGKFTVDFSYADPAVYLGGITGFNQGYSTDYSGSVSYCSVNADIDSVGAEALFAVGGIAGATVGTAQSAPVYINNCVYNGNITGNNILAGGIVGYLREYSSVANTFTSGSVNAYSALYMAAAGGIVGIADNETAVTDSYTVAESFADGSGDEAFESGDIVGAAYRDGISGVDSRSCLLFNSYYSDNGKVTVDDVVYDLSKFEDVKTLLKWSDGDWDFRDGKPVVVCDNADDVSFNVTFDFLGEEITREGNDGQPLTQDKDTVTAGGYLPVYWVYNGNGMNNFTADSGNISYGYFLDRDCTQRIPAAMLLTRELTVYVGFADYSSIGGEYDAIIGLSEVRLEFDNNGKMTMYCDGMVSNHMYVYDNEKLLISNAYFANFMYQSTTGASLDADYYATFEGNSLIIYDNVYFPAGSEIFAYKQNDACGEWYNANNDIYTFRADGSGLIAYAAGTQSNFTYTVTGDDVALNIGGNTVNARLSADRRTMTVTGGGILAMDRFDEFLGEWESDYGSDIRLSFDGRGVVTFGEEEYAYTVNEGGTLSFEGYTAAFNSEGLLELTGDGKTIVMGRGGSFIGTWEETFYDYTMVLYGINKDGYGKGYDSNGVDFTYSATFEQDEAGDYYYLNLYYGTKLYGFGAFMQLKTADGYKPGEGVLAMGVFTSSAGMIVDDYNLCYVDKMQGVWNGENGMTLEFNGLGIYNIEMTFSGGTWRAVGEVTVTEGEESSVVRYDYDRLNQQASFTYKDKSYTVAFSDDGITVSENGGAAVAFRAPDEFSAFSYVGNGVRLTFNGKSNVGLGKATVSADGTEKVYDYTVSDGVATLKEDGQIVYTASADQDTKLLKLAPVTGDAVNLGIYNLICGRTYIGVGGVSLSVNEYFTLDGTAGGALNGEAIDFVYIDEKTAGIYLDGYLYYIAMSIDENNVALYDSYGQLATVLCVADGLQGTYTSADGDTVTLDGRSLNAAYYAYATMIIDGEEYVYVYRAEESGETAIYLLDRSGSTDELIKVYTIYTEEEASAVAYVSSDDKTIWLKAE